jgi:hypothetical protein
MCRSLLYASAGAVLLLAVCVGSGPGLLQIRIMTTVVALTAACVCLLVCLTGLERSQQDSLLGVFFGGVGTTMVLIASGLFLGHVWTGLGSPVAFRLCLSVTILALACVLNVLLSWARLDDLCAVRTLALFLSLTLAGSTLELLWLDRMHVRSFYLLVVATTVAVLLVPVAAWVERHHAR